MVKFSKHLSFQSLILLGLLIAAKSTLAQSWHDEAGMKLPRVEATTVEYRGDIYVFNGFSFGLAIADSVEKYDAATKSWDIISRTSVDEGNAVTHNGVVRVGADVWIIGGRVGRHPGRVSKDVWIFNLDNHQWRRGPNLPVAGAAGGAALVNNRIHWFGGLDTNASCDVDRHVVYDLGKPGAGWQNISAKAGMPAPRNHFSTAVVDGIIYAMGGQFGHDACPGKHTQDTTLVHAFNPETNQWSQKADMPNKNSHSEPGTFVYRNEIYTTGGENAKNKVWKYNPETNKWSTFRTLLDELVAPVARIIDGHLIVAGGGAPIAQQATNKVRSLLVDNNPPALDQEPMPTVVVSELEPTPVPGSQEPEEPTLISMEAEYFDISTPTSTHQWVHATIADSSNDAALITTPDQGDLAASIENTPMLSYMVFFNSPGKHYIWVRGLGDTDASGLGNSDSIQVGLNGEVAESAFRIVQFPSEWTWSRTTPSNAVASINVVDAGVNMINLWMREDGLAIDKFVISSDPDFVPTGFGPEVTDGTDDFVPPVSVADTTVDYMELDDVSEANTEEMADVLNQEEGEVTESTMGVGMVDMLSDESEVLNDDATSADPVTAETVLVNFATVDSVEPSFELSLGTPDNREADTSGVVEGESIDSLSVSSGTASSGGLFGGASSLAGLLSLMALCLVRVVRGLSTEVV